MDIHDRSNHASRSAFFVPHRMPGPKEPAVIAILALQSVLDVERLLLVEVAVYGFECSCMVIRVQKRLKLL